MRILILTVFFASSFYYFLSGGPALITDTPIKDAIKIKSSAPARPKVHSRPLAVRAIPKILQQDEVQATQQIKGELDVKHEEIAHLSWKDLDQQWNFELKELLDRLEPLESEGIHKAYVSEVESYKAEMEALINERQFKASNLQEHDVDQLIGQLDERHEESLREIFGAHYEAIKDHYNYYMEANQALEE